MTKAKKIPFAHAVKRDRPAWKIILGGLLLSLVSSLSAAIVTAGGLVPTPSLDAIKDPLTFLNRLEHLPTDFLDAQDLQRDLCDLSNTEASRLVLRHFSGVSEVPEDWRGSVILRHYFPTGLPWRQAQNQDDVHQALRQSVETALARAASPQHTALLHSHAADFWLSIQRHRQALKHVQAAIDIPNLDAIVSAHILNNLANLYSIQKKYPQALQHYAEALDNAPPDSVLSGQILINQMRAYWLAGQSDKAEAVFQPAWQYWQHSDDTKTAPLHSLSLGKLVLDMNVPTLNPLPVLQHAEKLARASDDKRLEAYALGYQATLYQQAQRHDEAQILTQQAVFAAQQIPELLYRWEWQLGRSLQAQHQLTEALDAYSRAVAELDNAPLRIGQRDSRDLFSQRIRPVYASLAEVVLHQAQQQELTHDLLRRSIATLERMKAAELAHYFKDPCVAKTKRLPAMPSTPPALNIPPRTALLYPFLLPDRIELLLLKTSKIHHLKVDASYTQVAETIKTFQKNLKIRHRWVFAEQSKQLYAWFIAPAKPMLKDIDTLVIVPDSVLRMVPPAAFYNAAENTFLVEEFALAITPALDLTDIQSVSTKDAIFLGGLSEGVQGFSPLPGVYEEIDKIESFFVEKNIVLDQKFIRQTLHDSLQNNSYSIVHLASHGQFSSDPEDSFILTYDDKLNLTQLSEVFASQNIDLLTLSACQTAVGDEQAALGFAGVAIKAGVRSALASLWYVSDEATSLLMSEFYQQLRQPGISKAQAFRLAQTKLLHSRAFRHPYAWAPFMLIGNWL